MLLNQKAIHRSMIAAATHEYINALHIESQNHCTAVVFAPIFYIVRDERERLCRGNCLLVLFFFFFFLHIVPWSPQSDTKDSLLLFRRGCIISKLMEEAKIWQKNTRSLKKCKEAIKKGCKCRCPQKGSKNRSFHDQTQGAICVVLLSSSPPHPSTFPTPQSSPIEPIYCYCERQGHAFLLTAVRSNIVPAHSSRLKADTFFLWPRYPLPVFSTLSFSPALLFRLSFSVYLVGVQTLNLSLLATAGWHHVCVCVGGGILCLHTSLFMFDLSGWERNCDILLMP